MAMCVIAVVGVAPCQCFSLGENQTTSPDRTSSIGPPSRCAQPMPDVTINSESVRESTSDRVDGYARRCEHPARMSRSRCAHAPVQAPRTTRQFGRYQRSSPLAPSSKLAIPISLSPYLSLNSVKERGSYGALRSQLTTSNCCNGCDYFAQRHSAPQTWQPL
jgi:hypothetical protein